MAKKANTPSPTTDVVIRTTYSSLKDMAYQHGGIHSAGLSMARYAMEKIPGFPEKISEEGREELVEGYQMRYDQLHPATLYAVIGDHFVIPSPEQLENESVEKVAIGVAYAYSYTQQEFGKLRNTRPALHKIVKDIRDSCSSYSSNRIKDLQRAAKELISGGKKRERGTNSDFAEFITKFFDETGPTRLKSAKARKDASADADRWSKARAAFLTAWLAK